MSIQNSRTSRSFADQLAAVRGLLLPGMDQMSLANDWAESRDTVALVLLAIFVGVLCGLAAFLFSWLINRLTLIFFPSFLMENTSPILRAAVIVSAPMIGGLIVGPLIAFFASEARGHGVPSVMRALVERGGIIHPNIAVVKTIASAVTLGSGGSAGREGPIVQIGASLGSAVGQLFRVRESKLRTLVICGASGGIAAIFNAPFAGVFYGTEVLLDEFEARAISIIVLTAVTASILIRALQGNHPAFQVPSYTLVSAWELGPYIVLGILCGLVSVLFIVALYASEDIFHVLALPSWIKPALGGLAVGVIGLLYPPTLFPLLPFPAIFSSTYVPIGAAVAGKLGLGLMVALLFGKLFATSLTLGSGGSGGVFGPSLFLGSMLGGAFGVLVNALFPGVTAPPGAYALVGMAAVLGAAGHAPITGVMLAFEMVDNYQMILPLMLTTVVAFLITRFVLRESIDTLALARAGISYKTRKPLPPAPGLLQRTPVGAVMTTDVQSVPPAMSLDELAQLFNESGHHGFPVVDGNDRLMGIVTLSDLEHAILEKASREERNEEGADAVPERVGDIMTTDLAVAYANESLEEALRTMAQSNVGRLPVVEPGDPTRVVGLLRRQDVIEAFRQSTVLNDTTDAPLRIGAWGGTQSFEISLAPDAPAANCPVRDLAPSLPRDTLIAAVRRAHSHEVLLPRGDTVLQPGDVVVVLTRPRYRLAARRLFESPNQASTSVLGESALPEARNTPTTDRSPSEQSKEASPPP